jgi:hypothetical protein
VFPSPVQVPRQPCRRCGTATRTDRAISGYGESCASLLGLTTATPRLRTEPQTGTNLLDLLNGDRNDEPDDECDGWDR